MMNKKNSISGHDEYAAEYDQQVREYECFAHEALFGLSFEHVNPHDRLLDIGIGTGLGSLLFARAGLEVFGIDGSIEMMKICESKNIAKDLKQFDLQNTPLPYSDGFFEHVISCGVFHFFDDLEPMFKEVSRIIKPRGIFAFTILAQTTEKEERVAGGNREAYSEMSREGITIFMHRDRYIEKLLQGSGFDKLKMLKFLVWSGQEDIDDLYYAYVAQRYGI
ncbi:class I SAM-dependent methyltransferase [candidate division KSB1 bacterium]|nr:class I SAM-dependent methyltransferase [candidate division KSB1 bacterium]